MGPRFLFIIAAALTTLIGCIDATDLERKRDQDNDGYLSVAFGGDDCDDTDGDVHPGADEIWYDGVRQDCSGGTDYDQDGDGFDDAAHGGTDCDDINPAISPDATEACDGVDNNCDGTLSPDEADLDGDGFGICDGDCDDADGNAYPGADEVCDSVDNDCDGDIDDADDDVVDAPIWYRDADEDGFGDLALPSAACITPPNYIADSTDCTDNDNQIYPGAPERCNGVDDDCDGLTDSQEPASDLPEWFLDSDGDTYGSGTPVNTCDPSTGFVARGGDCNESSASIHPGATESCNLVDDNCNGSVDELAFDAANWYIDDDNDGYGLDVVTIASCSRPAGYAAFPGDCDDMDPNRSPGQPEICNGFDDDCDLDVDDDDLNVDYTVAPDWYLDFDTDTFGTGIPMRACAQPAGYADNGADCDDIDDQQYPGAQEYCNGEDDDCDLTPDNNSPADAFVRYADTDGDGWGDPNAGTAACPSWVTHVDNAVDCDDTQAGQNQDDADTDGVTSCDGDCDDGDIVNFPGNLEVCDGQDNDCDGLDDFGNDGADNQEVDADGDGLAACEGDCDDGDVNNWTSCATCDDLDGDGNYAGCDDYQGLREDCDDSFDPLSPPLVECSSLPCFLPFVIDTCVWDPSVAATFEVPLDYDTSGSGDVGVALMSGSPTVTALRDQLADQCADGPVSIGDLMTSSNGLVNAFLTDVVDTINGDLAGDTVAWDTSSWGPLPTQDVDSDISPGSYGTVIEGPVALVDAGCGSWNQSVEVVGFAWVAIFDARGSGAGKFIRMRPEVTTPYHAGGYNPNAAQPAGNVH